MKRKTWIVSALMYALVFLVCFGVLHVFKKITTAGDSTEYTSKAAAETNIVIDGSADDTDRENGKMDGAEGSDLSEDTDELWNETEKNTHIRRETGYKGWSKTLPQVWPEVPEEEHYTPPRIIQATDVHYQSADAEDDGAAFQLFVERCDGKVVKYLPQLLDAAGLSGSALAGAVPAPGRKGAGAATSDRGTAAGKRAGTGPNLGQYGAVKEACPGALQEPSGQAIITTENREILY